MRPFVMFTWMGMMAAAIITFVGGEWQASIVCSVATFVLYTVWEKM